jgi:4-hydroxy-4-methyl-2-oxoglutarate aldolase
VQHVGSVHIFLEALADASPGDVLVVDNAGRLDEACVGDLIAHVVGATDCVAADDDGVLWQTESPFAASSGSTSTGHAGAPIRLMTFAGTCATSAAPSRNEAAMAVADLAPC